MTNNLFQVDNASPTPTIPTRSFIPTAIAISYAPNSDETYLKIPTDTSEKVEIKVLRALATAAFNAAQIANGSPIAPNEKIVIHTYFDGLTHTARQIYIGPI